MAEFEHSQQEQDSQGDSEKQLEDLEVREAAQEITGGRVGDPDEGGQAQGSPVQNRLASNSNETLVEDDS